MGKVVAGGSAPRGSPCRLQDRIDAPIRLRDPIRACMHLGYTRQETQHNTTHIISYHITSYQPLFVLARVLRHCPLYYFTYSRWLHAISPAPVVKEVPNMLAPHPTWQEIAAEKKQSIDDKIPQEWRIGKEQFLTSTKSVLDLPRTCGLMTDLELSITELSAVQLLAVIHSGKLTAVETTRAFCKRAAIAHQAVR